MLQDQQDPLGRLALQALQGLRVQVELLEKLDQLVLQERVAQQVPQGQQEVSDLRDQLVLLARLDRRVLKAQRVRLARLAQLDLQGLPALHQRLQDLLVRRVQLEQQALLVRLAQQDLLDLLEPRVQ